MRQRAMTINLGDNAKYKTLDDYLKVLNQQGWVLDSFAYLTPVLPNDPQQVTIVAHQDKTPE